MSRVAAWLCRRTAAPAVVLALAAGLAACTSGHTNSGQPAAAGATPSGGTGNSAAGLQQDFERVVAQVLPSVVEIRTRNGTGSGVVYDSAGNIVTNAHVVGNATDVTVLLATGSKQLPAKVIGTFAPDDLAVVRADTGGSSLRPATFGRSAGVRIGQIVLAMGNPLGLTASVTEGIVSATGRTVSEAGATGAGGTSSALITSAIQTSAPINPGNSGGALVDLSARVIGIPTLAALQPENGGAAPGIGFAIPSDTVRNIAGQLIADGRVTRSDRAALGISAETVASDQGQPAGAGVVSVTNGGPAAKAGLKPGDVIVSVAGQPTPDTATLQSVLAAHKPGDKVQLKVLRPGTGQTHTISITLGSLAS
jgi:S1-C subfamily serine protease